MTLYRKYLSSTVVRICSAEDCAVCTDGYASGSAYSCHKCSGAAGRSATWLAVLALIVAIVVVFVTVSDLVRVVGDDGSGTAWGRRRLAGRRFISKAFPLTAIKTVVVVWQIVTQVWKHTTDERGTWVRSFSLE